MKEQAHQLEAEAARDMGERLRLVMRSVPSPVTVVTAGTEAPRGVTIGSFTSLSLHPPLVQFGLMKDSLMLPVLEQSGRFNVHVLRDDQATLGYHFALPGLSPEGQFLAVPFRRDAHGTPVLEDCLSVLLCRVHDVIDAGDHVLMLGWVEETEGPREGTPLLYLDRAFRSVGDEIEISPSDLPEG